MTQIKYTVLYNLYYKGITEKKSNPPQKKPQNPASGNNA